jgi:hypothetical protein
MFDIETGHSMWYQLAVAGVDLPPFPMLGGSLLLSVLRLELVESVTVPAWHLHWSC